MEGTPIMATIPEPDDTGRDPGAEIVPFPAPPGRPDTDTPDASDTSFEVELDDEPATGPEPVDDGFGYALPDDEDEYPVIPHHLRTLAGIGEALGRHGRLLRHRTAFHGLRSPVYLVKALGWAVVGAARMAGRVLSWWWVPDMDTLASHAVASSDSREYMRLHREAKDTRLVRGLILLAGTVVTLLALLIAARLAPGWAWLALAAAAVPVLARAGRPEDAPIIAPATTVPRFRVLNADTVRDAYYDAGLGNPDKPGGQVEFETRLAHDGTGSGVGVILPRAVTFDDALKARPKLASALDVAVSQVYLTPSPVSHRRHRLWVADVDPLAVPVGRTPLLACKPTDIWQPAPLGLDERGQLVTLLLMWVSVLIGALPRMGKTFVARLLGLFAALDPFVKLDVFDPSGKPDWRKFALVADSFAFGLTPTREGIPAEIFLATLEGIKKDVQDRYNRLSKLPPNICPEGKLTREIARDPDFAMPVRGLFLDEFHEWFDLGEISKDIAANLVYVAKVAPAAGVFLVDATQKPSGIGGGGNVGQQFTAFRDNHQVRLSLRTANYNVSEMVLGQGAYGEGLDASTLLPSYKGVGILRGASDDSPTVRTHLADADDTEKILTAARRFRERAGTLSGMAAGEAGNEVRDVLADVLACFAAGEPGLWWPVLAERLARRFPDRWADATADAISAQCRDLKVPSVDVKTSGTVRKGCRRADVQRAANPA
jgi:S-DNA-T family DNA segregation ATPase FtsK/SpoIIIE